MQLSEINGQLDRLDNVLFKLNMLQFMFTNRAPGTDLILGYLVAEGTYFFLVDLENEIRKATNHIREEINHAT